MKKFKSEDTVSPPTPKTEIFVFTPEILAKLQINIQNALVTNSETGSAQNPVHNDVPKIFHDNNDRSSIIETANLMKQSVFLSPTFNTTSTTLPEEIPIYQNEVIDRIDDYVVIDDESSDNFNTQEEGTIPPVVHVNNLGQAKDYTRKQKKSSSYKSMKEYQNEIDDGKLLLTHVSNEDTNDAASIISERSNIISTNFDISENCKDIQNYTSEASNIDINHGNYKSANKAEILPVNGVVDQSPRENKKHTLKAENMAIDKDQNLIIPNSAENAAVLDDRNDNNNKSLSSNKVVTKQINDEMHRDSQSKIDNRNTLAEINSKYSMLSSQKDEEIMKLSDKITPPSIATTPNQYIDTFQLSHDTQNNTQTIAIGSSKDFCICYDFGKLAYYDCEMLYEHLHFWQSKSTSCDPEIMYSIYYNDCSPVLKESRESVELKYDYNDNDNMSDGDKIFFDHICWNAFAADDVDLPITCTKDVKNKKDNTLRSHSIVPQTNSPVIENETYRDVENIRKRGTHRGVNNTSSDQLGITRATTSAEHLTNSEAYLDSRKEESKPASIKIKTSENSDVPSSVRRLSKKGDVSISNAHVSSEKKKINSVVKEKSPQEDNVTNLRSRRTINTQKDDKDLDAKQSVLTDPLPRTKQYPSPGKPVPITYSKKKEVNTSSSSDVSQQKISDKSNVLLKPHTKSVSPSKLEKTNEKIIESPKSSKQLSDMSSDTLQKNIKLEKTDKKLCDKKFETKHTSKTQISNKIYENIKIKQIDDSETSSVENGVSSEPVSHHKVNQGVSKEVINEKIMNGNEPNTTDTAKSFVPELTVPITNNNTTNDSNLIEIEISIEPSDTCGMCGKVVAADQWIDHISKDHNYIAWRLGEPALDLNDEIKLRIHLQAISNTVGKLVCSKCGLVRKFAKPFLRHIKECNDNKTMDDSVGSDLNTTQEPDDDDIPLSTRKSSRINCGVCTAAVYTDDWFKHIKSQHKYLAWKREEEPINLNSEDEVKEHLNNILKQHGLECHKCGAVCDTVTMYLFHEESCSIKCESEGEYECGVCLQKGDCWEDHVMNCHYNIGWKAGETPLDLKNDNLIDKCLRDYRLKKYTLKCNNCDVMRASTRGFFAHIVTCGKTEEEIDEFREVCEICETKYLSIYKRQHMNLHKDQVAPNPVKRGRKSKAQLNDEEFNPGSSSDEDCKGPPNKKAKLKKSSDTDVKLTFLKIFTTCDDLEQKTLKCGVCEMEVETKEWMNHAHKVHSYLAWIDGEKPLDVEDECAVRAHLSRVALALGALSCARCGETRKHAHAYTQHVRACSASGYNSEIVVPEDLGADSYECGVCRERGPLHQFKEHAMNKHYNIAWMAGEQPINLKNFYAVDKYLKEYNKSFKLLCQICKAFRCSTYGFYAHILQCGKTEEELDAVHNVCDICKNKYLCIYKNQHVAMHRDQEHRRDKKRLQEEENYRKELENKTRDEHPTGKRRAAEKAKKVIEKYSSNADGKPVCSSCGTIFDSTDEVSDHRCHDNGDESDASVKLEANSDESDDSDVDSNASVEDQIQPKKRTRHGEGSTKITRMAHRPYNWQSYLAKGYKDFVKAHYSTESLFNEWRNSEYRPVPKEEIPKYLPTVTESCQVSVHHGQWNTFKIFEARKSTVFTGGAVQCMSWVPDGAGSHFLSVVAHRTADAPRYSPADLPRDPALLQIWTYGNFTICAYLSLALALDYGVVWAMDWCPSGARDPPPATDKDSEKPKTIAQKVTQTLDKKPIKISDDVSTSMSHKDFEDLSNDTKMSPNGSYVDPNMVDSKDAAGFLESSAITDAPRLGLVALACSNGSAYIIAVPYPPEKTEIENVIYRPKPCAELRFSISSKRRMYQATSIQWSQQKGHSIVIVGYSDGATALYDLNTESPLLKDTENGITIFYPFQDKLSENSAITGLVLTPTLDGDRPAGAVGSTSQTGCSLRAGVLAAPVARSPLAAAGAAPAPLWPAFNVYGDMPFTSKSATELEWWGGGRRLGAARAGAACARCGHAAAVCAPAVRLLRAHPLHLEIKKQIVATLLMVPLGNKGKRKKVNDDLSVVVEPLTYEDAVAKYGLQISYASKKDQALIQKVCSENENGPERFPLSEVVAASFCPSHRYHDKLALATYSGVVFVINTK